MEARRPSVAAALIVRDEEAGLVGCLASLAAFVDEIVVCDTGSVDATVTIARQAGAKVFAFEWCDDFSAARNAALAACSADWVLSVDADETVAGVPDWLRPMLEVCGDEVDALQVQITNASGPDARGLAAHPEVKLLRRAAVRWAGRVHERLVPIGTGGLVIATLPAETLEIVHHGYVDPQTVAKKAERNARLARLELADLRAVGAAPDEIARAALDLGRSEWACGNSEEAVAALQLARELSASGELWRWATDFLLRDLQVREELDEAMRLVDELEADGAPADYCRLLRAQLHLQRGELAAASTLLNGIDALTDLSGRPLDMAVVNDLRSQLEQVC